MRPDTYIVRPNTKLKIASAALPLLLLAASPALAWGNYDYTQTWTPTDNGACGIDWQVQLSASGANGWNVCDGASPTCAEISYEYPTTEFVTGTLNCSSSPCSYRLSSFAENGENIHYEYGESIAVTGCGGNPLLTATSGNTILGNVMGGARTFLTTTLPLVLIGLVILAWVFKMYRRTRRTR